MRYNKGPRGIPGGTPHITLKKDLVFVVLVAYIKPCCLSRMQEALDTRWCSSTDATDAAFQGYQLCQSALGEIAADDSENWDTRNEPNAWAENRLCLS